MTVVSKDNKCDNFSHKNCYEKRMHYVIGLHLKLAIDRFKCDNTCCFTTSRRFNRIRQVAAIKIIKTMRAHWRHVANTIELVHPSAHWSPQSKRQIDMFSRFCTAYTAESAYTLQWAPLSTRIMSLPMEDLDLPCNT